MPRSSELNRLPDSETIKVRTPKEAAAFLRVSVNTLKTWRSKKRGPDWTYTGRSVKYRIEQLQAYLDRNNQSGDGSKPASKLKSKRSRKGGR